MIPLPDKQVEDGISKDSFKCFEETKIQDMRMRTYFLFNVKGTNSNQHIFTVTYQTMPQKTVCCRRGNRLLRQW